MDDEPKIIKNTGNRGKGRPKGSPNRVGRELREIARDYTEQAISTLAEIMTTGESETARVAASNAILDRGYGKPSQLVGSDPHNPLPAPQPAVIYRDDPSRD